jgi:predicted DNA binding CopG/RHH family protein
VNKIINNKRYNTYSARFLGEWNNGKQPGDFEFVRESLYVTKSGNYFLHGEGGGGSDYCAKSLDEHPNGCGEVIKPLSAAEAQRWAEKVLDANEFTVMFTVNTVANETEVEKITLSLPTSVIKALKERKEATGVNVSWLVAQACIDAGYQLVDDTPADKDEQDVYQEVYDTTFTEEFSKEYSRLLSAGKDQNEARINARSNAAKLAKYRANAAAFEFRRSTR